MFFFKLLLVAAAAVAVMVALKDGRILAETGFRGSCAPLVMPASHSESWHACSEGRLTGRPDMSRHNCTAQGLRGELEVWRCPADLSSARRTS